MPLIPNMFCSFGVERCKDMYLISIYNAFIKVFLLLLLLSPMGIKNFSGVKNYYHRLEKVLSSL